MRVVVFIFIVANMNASCGVYIYSGQHECELWCLYL